jgi:IS5 family transposase
VRAHPSSVDALELYQRAHADLGQSGFRGIVVHGQSRRPRCGILRRGTIRHERRLSKRSRALLIALKVVHGSKQLKQPVGAFAFQSAGESTLCVFERLLRDKIAGALDEGS